MMRKFAVDVEFLPEEIVYLKTDSDQLPRMVTGYFVRASGNVTYYLACGTEETVHHGFEISSERDIIMTTSN